MLVELNDSDPILTIGELRGLLAALAWMNGKTNFQYTFTLEKLPDRPEIAESLSAYLGDHLTHLSMIELDDWLVPVRDSLRLWLFQQLDDLVKREEFPALLDSDDQREIVAKVLRMIEGGVRPTKVWRVAVETKGFYECAWDDFALLGEAGGFLLHLGVSD